VQHHRVADRLGDRIVDIGLERLRCGIGVIGAKPDAANYRAHRGANAHVSGVNRCPIQHPGG
jgi:hypothetical protein